MKLTIPPEQKLALMRQRLTRLHGASVIIPERIEEDFAKTKILVGRATYGEKLIQLPGGAVERGEIARHAGQSETEEETGLIIHEQDFSLLGLFIQRITNLPEATGYLSLYECMKHDATYLETETEELTEIRFESIEELIEKHRDECTLATRRLVVHYLRIKTGFARRVPIEGRLSDPVEYVRNGVHLLI